MAKRLPHQIVISFIASVAHSTMFIAEWIEQLAPYGVVAHLSGILARGYAIAFDLGTGPFLIHAIPRLIGLLIWLLRMLQVGLERLRDGGTRSLNLLDALVYAGKRKAATWFRDTADWLSSPEDEGERP